MKAWFLHHINDLDLEQTELPVPAEQEVLVEVKAAGICGSDIPRIYQTGAYSYPLIPGHEFSGTVAAVGPETDVRWLDQRVGIFPLIPCGSCVPCQNMQYEMCRHYSYLGSRTNGGFSEYALVPVRNLLPLPDSVSFCEAAMLEPMAVAVHAMRRTLPSPSDTVAVWGLGTIGLLLLMFLKEAGIENILAVGNKDFQKQMACQTGLSEDCYCDSRQQDPGQWLMECTEGRGADVSFECVGKNETCSSAIENTAPGGKVLLLGNPHSHMELKKDVYWKILRNQLTITGTWNSSFTRDPEDDWNYALKRLVEKRISPARLITHRFPLEKLDKGLEIMRDKTEDFVKIMVTAP